MRNSNRHNSNRKAVEAAARVSVVTTRAKYATRNPRSRANSASLGSKAPGRRPSPARPSGCERDARTNTVTMLAVTCPSHEFLSDVPGRPGEIKGLRFHARYSDLLIERASGFGDSLRLKYTRFEDIASAHIIITTFPPLCRKAKVARAKVRKSPSLATQRHNRAIV